MLSRKIFALLLLLWIACCPAAGQENNTDQAESELLPFLYNPAALNALKPSDTVPISDQINYSLTIIMSKPDSAAYLLHDALAKSRYLEFNCGIATALADLAYMNSIKGQYDQALRYYRKAEPYAIKGLKNRTSLAMFYTCMSTPFLSKYQFDSVYYYSKKAERIINGIRCKTSGEVIDVSSIYNNMAMLWTGVSDFKKALGYLYQSAGVIAAFPKNRKRLDVEAALINSNIGIVHLQQKKFDSARIYLNRAYPFLPEHPLTLMGLAELQVADSNHREATALFRKAIAYAQRANNYSITMSAKAMLGIQFYEQKDYKQAKLLLNEVVALSRENGNIDLESTYRAYEALSAISALEGNYKLAYQQEQHSLKLMDSLKVKEKKISVYALESELGAANREKAMARQQLLLSKTQNKLREKNLWMAGTGAGVVLLSILLLSLYRNSKTKQRIQLKELNGIRQEQEIKDLQSMIKGEEKERARMAREIHDGIMVQLSTIKMKMKSVPDVYQEMNNAHFLATDYYRQLVDQMEDATRDLRSTAHNLMPDMLLQGGLEDAVLYFCNSIKRNTSLHVEFQKHGSIAALDKEFELSVYRIIQELLQNVIKHAEATQILVQMAMLTDDLLTITIEDNGKGFDQAKAINGMGLVSIRNRLRVMNGFIDISSQEGKGTSVHIEFDQIFSTSLTK
jgi:signal transduction histidine kinase